MNLCFKKARPNHTISNALTATKLSLCYIILKRRRWWWR